MYESAKHLESEIVEYFTSEAGRPNITPELSVRFRFDKFLDQEPLLREQQWEVRTAEMRRVLPTVITVRDHVDKVLQGVSKTENENWDGGEDWLNVFGYHEGVGSKEITEFLAQA